ncbi:MAG: translation initiation factor [Pirellulaceae bacterium]|nr:translation initiation factor [Pirellulaceae bacterium]
MGLFDGTSLERPVLCERCRSDVKLCKCPPLPQAVVDTLPEKQLLKVRLEKRKRGKLVTVISGFTCIAAQLQQTLSHLQSQCGAGGSIDQQNIELQGDHTARVPTLLIARGYRIQGIKSK